MEFFMCGAVVRAVVKSLFRCQFDPIDEFHVGAFVNLGGVASRKVGDEEPHRPTRLCRQRLAIKAVNNQGPISHRSQRNAGMEVISRGMKAEVFRVGLRLNKLQNTAKSYRVALPAGNEAADVNDL